MISIKDLNAIADIPEIYSKYAGKSLRRNGQNLVGRCPFCEARGEQTDDRFRIRTDINPQRWYCSHCNPKGGSAIDFYAGLFHLPTEGAGLKRTAEDFATFLGQYPEFVGVPSARSIVVTDRAKRELKPFPKPSTEWQLCMSKFVDKFAQNLFDERYKSVLEYLTNNRKFTEQTLQEEKIGFNPKLIQTGLRYELDNGSIVDVRIPAGIVIPTFYEGNLLRVKVRTGNPNEKYKLVLKSKAKTPHGGKVPHNQPNVLFTEGELDRMTVYQCARDLCHAVTFGSCDCIGDAEHWGDYYSTMQNVRICFDNDLEPEKREHVHEKEQQLKWEIMDGQSMFNGTSQSVVVYHLPERFNDWNEVLQQEGTEAVRHYVKQAFEEQYDAE